MWLRGGGEGRFAWLPLGSRGEHGVPVAWAVLGNTTGGVGKVEAWPLCVPWGNPEVEGSQEAVEWQRCAQNYVSADRSSVLFSSG